MSSFVQKVFREVRDAVYVRFDPTELNNPLAPIDSCVT